MYINLSIHHIHPSVFQQNINNNNIYIFFLQRQTQTNLEKNLNVVDTQSNINHVVDVKGSAKVFIFLIILNFSISTNKLCRKQQLIQEVEIIQKRKL